MTKSPFDRVIATALTIGLMGSAASALAEAKPAGDKVAASKPAKSAKKSEKKNEKAAGHKKEQEGSKSKP